MATRKKTASIVNRKSSKAAKKPPAPKFTQEELVGEIAKLLDQVDEVMANRETGDDAYHVQWLNSQWGDAPLKKHREKADQLFGLLDEIMNPEGHYDNDATEDLIKATFSAEPGTIPAWSRPGRFIQWIGYIPYGCYWGGFFKPDATLTAIDPTLPFSEMSGFHFAHGVANSIHPEWRTVADGFNASLRQLLTVKEFKLVRLSSQVAEEIKEWRAKEENAWALPILKRGPVDELPLPARYLGFQRRMFA